MPHILSKNLCYQIDGKDILRDISFNTQAKSIGIIGRNGCGKTSLARLLAGLITPSSGSVTIDGKDMAKDRAAALETVGILFQNPDHQILFPSVIEEVSFGLRQLGKIKVEAEAMAEETLARFGLLHWRDAAVMTLSGGQRHMLCLIAVMAMRPKVLILDEPFVGLDIPTKMQLLQYFSELDATWIQITHQTEDLANYAEVLWVDAGTIALQGTPSSVLPAYTAEMQRQGGMNDLADLAR